MTESNKPLAWLLASLTALYAVAYRVLPYDVAAYLIWPFTALGLYSGARLRWWASLTLVLGVQALTDAILYIVHQWEASYATYLSFGFMVLLGRGLLKNSHSAMRVFSGITLGYVAFFLITNTAAWGETALPEYQTKSINSLLAAYRQGLEFLRAQPMQVFGQYLFGGMLFGAHTVLAKQYFPAEVVSPETVR